MDTAQRVRRAAMLREAQDMEAALAEIAEAARADPASPQAAFGHAQIAFEAWRPAAALFAQAARLIPGNPELLRNQALALAAEGDQGAAEALLETTLEHHPGWLDGHRTLAAMRITAGEADGWDRAYARACAAEPANLPLALAWFQQHATLKRWPQARTILEGAKARCAPAKALELSELFLDCESGEAGADMAARFAPHATSRDPGTDLCRLRHHLRSHLHQGEVEAAEAIAAAQLATPAARLFWPYAALCWRLLDDPRGADPLYTRTIDLDFAPGELDTLAGVLRGLHRMRAPYPEQSVRGGTQTDRQLFFHPDPAIQSLRARALEAVARYADALPPPVPGHPLLEHRPEALRFEGSWSVRLAGAGFHAPHSHTLGWVSSALYVALPPAPDMGPPPAGWLAFGSPPPELGLPLEPLARIEPQAGRLALFPSTLWHATEPFGAGERLTVAFDIKLAPPPKA